MSTLLWTMLGCQFLLGASGTFDGRLLELGEARWHRPGKEASQEL